MTLISTDTPLYNHPLPEIERWLMSIGCEQDSGELHCWHLRNADWQAELCLDAEEVTVRYASTASLGKDNPKSSADYQGIYRTFKYSLSRQDVENAVLGGP